MRPSELSNLLWAQVDRVAPHLLPNGKKEGHEWVAGNVNGDKGNSLKVNLSGKKKWADFAEGDGGDMLDLWMACRGINLQARTDLTKSVHHQLRQYSETTQASKWGNNTGSH